MRPTVRNLQQAAKLVLFTRANCSLCEAAKSVVADVRKKHQVSYSEIDIMALGHEKWKEIYEFDVPVVIQMLFHCQVPFAKMCT